MDAAPATHALVSLLADASRGRMLEHLMDGRARTAKELAFAATVSPQTASFHLGKLVGASLLAVEAQGRHRYYRIANPDVARALEAMMTLAGRSSPAAPASGTAPLPPIKAARFCYDHLAGRLGVELLSRLLQRRHLVARDGGYDLTRRGEKWVASLGIAVGAVRLHRRRFACSCLDWSERRPHLGGALGSALAARFVTKKWIRRTRDSRVVQLTELGRQALAEHLDWRIDPAG